MDWIIDLQRYGYIAGLIVVIACIFIGRMTQKWDKRHRAVPVPPKPAEPVQPERTNPYHKKEGFFSPTQRKDYDTLVQLAKLFDLTVFFKVRLLDLFESLSDDALHKLGAKAVEFLFWDDRSNRTVLIVERHYNGSWSYEWPDRNKFVMDILKAANYQYYYFYKEIQVDMVRQMLDNQLPKRREAVKARRAAQRAQRNLPDPSSAPK